MNSYGIFARFYDSLTENVDYKVRSEYISNFFYKYGKADCTVCDLACGTGSICKFLTERGYDVIGVDLSEDMLSIASQKLEGKANFIKADMTDFSLPSRVDAFVCSLDSINHLDSLNKVKACFKCVADNLNKDGIFIFDVNTIYKHKCILSDNTFVFDEDDFYLVWDNEYLGDNEVRILLDFFIFNGSSYDRFSEEFVEKAYSIDDLTASLSDFEILGIYDELTLSSPDDESERIYFVCKRK